MEIFAEIKTDWDYIEAVSDSFVIPEILLNPRPLKVGG